MDAQKDLELLVQSRHPVVSVETIEEQRLTRILQDLSAKLNLPLYVWTVTEGLRKAGSDAAIYGSKDPVLALGNAASIEGDALYLFKDLHRHLGDPRVVRKLRDASRSFQTARRSIVLSGPPFDVPPELQDTITRYALELPSEAEHKKLVHQVLQDLSRRHKIRVALSTADFKRLLNLMKGMTLAEAERALTRAILEDLALTPEDLDFVLKIKKELLDREGLLDYSTPGGGMNNIGGMANLKAWLRKREAAFSPDAQRFGLEAPKGILLLGVQGCGKSAAAKAIAREWRVPLVRLEIGRIYEKFMGESEKKLEKALNTVERLAPCVLMIDEIEKALAATAGTDADGGLSQRIFGRLLGWLQERKAPVFTVATCNDISRLPPELMRKGRFDEIFFVDLPGAKERAEIFSMHLAKRRRDPAAFDLHALARGSEGFSGAEIEQGIVSGLYSAYSQKKDLDTPILLAELAATKPLSVTRGEAIQALRDWARERTVPAN